MDLPRGLPTYQHRVGRTARAGQGGTAISMVDDAARRRRPTPPWAAPLHAACCDQVDDADAADAGLLQALRGEYGDALRQFSVDFRKLSAFRYPNPPSPRYRVDDAMRAVTRAAVREARLKEIKQELLHSKRLSEHFASNPDDLDALRHDKPLATVRRQPHLENVPAYLKPDTEGATAAVAPVASRRRPRDGRKARRPASAFGGGGSKRRKDPLQTFKGGGGRAGKGRRK